MNLAQLPPDLNSITRPNWIEINLDALASNIQFVRKSIPKKTKILLPVKADSYGHGSLACAYAAKNSGADFLGVAHLSEGMLLRQYGMDLPILILGPCIPADFPYTVRLVSQILESNGSSSMATVCAGTLALMDAGVPMKKPVSGIAMGLIKNPGEDKYAVLSDILGDEDHLGDMDFKTTGTKDGLTATQMDIKCDGLSFEILEKALMQAKRGREYILGKLTDTISEPRAEMKPQVPRIVSFDIPKEFIGAVIGPGGKIIQQIQEESGAVITIDELDGKGKVQVSAPNKDSIDVAISKIKAIVAIPEVGEVYEGTVRSVMPYGCFVEIMPGKDGLLHISEIDWKRLETVEEAGLKEGDKISVKLVDIDQKTGKYKLSHRVLLPKPEGYVERERRPRPERRPRGERNATREQRRFEHREASNDFHDPMEQKEPKDFNDSLDKLSFD